MCAYAASYLDKHIARVSNRRGHLTKSVHETRYLTIPHKYQRVIPWFPGDEKKPDTNHELHGRNRGRRALIRREVIAW